MGVEPDAIVVGFVGIGVMGQSMARHVLSAGYRLHLFTRTKDSAKTLCAQGAIWEESLANLAKISDVIISMVGLPDDVQQIYFDDDGILNHAKKGATIIDMTTSRPDLAIRIYDAAKQKEMNALDAPVSGGDLGAKNASLSIMVGGDKDIFDAVLPILKLMGKNIVFQGESGSGQSTKMANQIAIASGMVGVCEAIAYAKKAGLDPETVLKSIGQGAAGSWSLNHLGPKMIAGDFDPGFYIKHFVKDMNIAAAASSQMGQRTPGLDLALSLYGKMIKGGDGNLGTQALFKLFK